jgi:serine/threonine/tyrosine-interacting protein
MTSLREDFAMSDSASTHMRNHTGYSYRLPTPPRITVPPPTYTTAIPGLVVGGEPTDQIDLSFLRALDLEDIVQRNTLLEWSYERRRQAQMIMPWLYLGPMVAARDKDFLAREGITMVLAIRAREKSLTGALQAARDVCAEVATIEVPSFYELIGKFTEANRLINSHLARMHQHSLETTGRPVLAKVLVFCESGNEKSAAVVAAYLMDLLNDFDYVKAMQVCQAQRFCVNFDDTIKNILRSHWDLVQARRSVATSTALQHNLRAPNGSTAQPPIAPKQKRRIEHTCDDDEMDMDDGLDASDALRFTGRDVTPFQNRGGA